MSRSAWVPPRAGPTRTLGLLVLLVTGANSWAASGCTTAIGAAFNATPIPAGSVVWFNSVLSVSGLHANPATIYFDNVTISFTAAGTPYTLSVPGATVTLSPTAASATTTFDAATARWETMAPSGLAGKVFLDGLTFLVPTALPGAINPVTWSGEFSSDTPGVTIQWQWAAAVYTMFGDDYGALGVKPVDDKKASSYQNLDPAGTPENFKAFVTSGALGKGGSNFTGSSSEHVVVSGCPACTTAADCDDGNACTTDTCDPQAGCLHTPIPGCTTTTVPPTTTTSSTITTSTTSPSVTTTTGSETTTTLGATTTTVVVATTSTSSTTIASTASCRASWLFASTFMLRPSGRRCTSPEDHR